MKIGFTASRNLSKYGKKKIENLIQKLEANTYIHGACIGGDAYIAKMVKKYHPKSVLIAVVPRNLSKVDSKSVSISDKVINEGNYRERNTRIVNESDFIIAFWNGKKIHSGTYMTINIARRKNKLKQIILIKGGEKNDNNCSFR